MTRRFLWNFQGEADADCNGVAHCKRVAKFDSVEQTSPMVRRLMSSLTSLLGLMLVMLSGCQTICHSNCSPDPSGRIPILASIPRLGIFRKPIEEPFFQPQKYSLFVSPDLPQKCPKRVLLVPTGTESGHYQAPIHFAEALAGAIRGAGVAEVIFPPQLNCMMTVDRLLAGQFDERDIVHLSRTWNCDAIMFIRVNQLKAFAPMQASVTAALVDANESLVIFAIDGNWDTTDVDIRKGFEVFVKSSELELGESQKKLQLQSPSRLFAYVAFQITEAWQTGIQ